MNLKDAFPYLTKEQFVETFRRLADEESGMEGIAYSGCDPENIRRYYLDAWGDRNTAKENFDVDMAELIRWTLSELGLDEPDAGHSLDWKGELYDWLEDAGFSWYGADQGEGDV